MKSLFSFIPICNGAEGGKHFLGGFQGGGGAEYEGLIRRTISF